jgi:hypothetical protein
LRLPWVLYLGIQLQGEQQLGQPVDSTQNMPDSLVTVGAMIGVIFIGYFLIVYYRSRKKKKIERPYNHKLDADLPFEKNDDHDFPGSDYI